MDAAVTAYLVRHGSPAWAKRFAAQVRVADDGCWLWTGRPGRNGYAQIRVDGHRPVAHRVIWELARGPVPDGLVLDHLCRVRHCVNPEHLEPVTPQENTLRSPVAVAAVFASRTHCGRGHEFSPENTGRRRDGGRWCRQCKREYLRDLAARRRAS